MSGSTRPGRIVVVDGCIATGKTTLVGRLGVMLGAETLFENYNEIKSLLAFYADPATHAFHTEVEFTKHHSSLLETLQTTPYQRVVCDFSLKRDLVYSEITLKEQPENLSTYKKLWDRLYARSPKPSAVILLEASVDTLLERVKNRGRDFEKGLTKEYLQALTSGIRGAYEDCDKVFQIDTTDFSWLNTNIDQVARQVLQIAEN